MKENTDFLICPVRGASEEVKKILEDYVAKLESEGKKVHYPPRDTDQSDPVGNKICEANFRAEIFGKRVHRWYDDGSTGGHFDFGGVFMLYVLKKLIEEIGEEKVGEFIKQPREIIFINKDQVPYNPGKSFQKVLKFLEEETGGESKNG